MEVNSQLFQPLYTIKRYLTIRFVRMRLFRSSPPDPSCARSKKARPFLATKFSPFSDRPVCSTSGNRRNEEHYSGGWKTPLITSRRAVRYPPDLPLPRLVVCGSPKLPSHFLGEDRRDYARALGRCYSSCTSFVVSHWCEMGRTQEGGEVKGRRITTRGGKRKIKRGRV